LQGLVAFNIWVLYKLDSPCHISEYVPFVFNERTISVVKLQDVLTVAQNALESPNLSSMVCFKNKPPQARDCCTEYVLLRSCFMYLSLAWLLYVQLYTLYIFNGIHIYIYIWYILLWWVMTSHTCHTNRDDFVCSIYDIPYFKQSSHWCLLSM
jgi:hypothetical protein